MGAVCIYLCVVSCLGDVCQILEWWGLAPELSSDSTKERVLKRFPHWARALVTDCVDGDWATSLAMILEKEQWAKDRQKALDDLTLSTCPQLR